MNTKQTITVADCDVFMTGYISESLEKYFDVTSIYNTFDFLHHVSMARENNLVIIGKQDYIFKGFSVTKVIRNYWPNCRIISLSKRPLFILKLLFQGADDYISKPFKLKALIKIINAQLNAKPVGDVEGNIG
ncbi:MAG: response regulator [Candidatus Margulisbacteria bacterium]|nr:response regulator [Candidatus Margulisiibacteriota bacterium]